MTTTSLLIGLLTLALATYTLRMGGVLIGSTTKLSQETSDTMSFGATVLLLAVAATSALYQGTAMDGAARPCGVLAATICTVCKLPVVVAVLVAVATTAALRHLGLS